MSDGSASSSRHSDGNISSISNGSGGESFPESNHDDNTQEVGKTRSILHNTRRTRFSSLVTNSSVVEAAKRKFREKRQHYSPKRGFHTTTTAVNDGRDHPPAFERNFFGVIRNTKMAVEGRPDRWKQFQQLNEDVNDEANYAGRQCSKFRRSFSMSPARSRGAGGSTRSSKTSRNKPMNGELWDEVDIRQVGGSSPKRRRDYERIATRALETTETEHETCSDATTIRIQNSKSPQRWRAQRIHDISSEDDFVSAPQKVSFADQDKDREIMKLRKDLKEFEEHLIKTLAAEENASKRLEKEKKRTRTASLALEELTKTVKVQNDQIQFLENRMKNKESEMERLKEELAESQTKCSKMELELEVHELKFSIYDDYRRLMDKQRLDTQIDSEYGSDEEDEFRISEETKKSNTQENDYTRVLAGLDILENCYKMDIAECLGRYNALQVQHENALREIDNLKRNVERGAESSVLESTTGSMSSNGITLNGIEVDSRHENRSSASNVASSNVVKMLEKRIQLLEADGRSAAMKLQGLRKELDRSRAMQNNLSVFSNENELSMLRLEKDSLRKRVSALETEIGYTSGQIDHKTRTRRYIALEKNLNAYIADILSLEDKLKAKDNVISTLKEKVMDCRKKAKEENMVLSFPSCLSTAEPESISPTRTGPTVVVVAGRFRLNRNIEELKMKSMQIGHHRETDETSSSNSGNARRIDQIRQRLKALGSSSSEHHPQNPR